jgi:hypothetical protein
MNSESASKTSGPPHASSWATPPEFYADENSVTRSVCRLLRGLGYTVHTPAELYGSRDAALDAQPGRYQEPQRPTRPPAAYRPPRKRRVFLWVFLGVQLLFMVWIISAVVSASHDTSAATEAAQQCANNGWYPLFKSQADCDVHYGHALTEAGNVGTGIGVALIVMFWVVVDFFLGLGYLVYKLASRR